MLKNVNSSSQSSQSYLKRAKKSGETSNSLSARDFTEPVSEKAISDQVRVWTSSTLGYLECKLRFLHLLFHWSLLGLFSAYFEYFLYLLILELFCCHLPCPQWSLLPACVSMGLWLLLEYLFVSAPFNTSAASSSPLQLASPHLLPGFMFSLLLLH